MADLEQLRQEAENLRKKIRVSCVREGEGREPGLCWTCVARCLQFPAPRDDLAGLGWAIFEG